jgi:hypothetical protein
LDSLNASVRLLRVIHVSFLISIGLFVWLSTILANTNTRQIKPLLYWILAVLSCWCVFTAFSFKKKLSGMSEVKFRAGTVLDAKEIRRWTAGYLVAFACSEAVVLYGFFALFCNASQYQVAPFFLAGTGLLIYFWPRSLSVE